MTHGSLDETLGQAFRKAPHASAISLGLGGPARGAVRIRSPCGRPTGSNRIHRYRPRYVWRLCRSSDGGRNGQRRRRSACLLARTPAGTPVLVERGNLHRPFFAASGRGAPGWTGKWHAVMWQDGVLSDLGTLPGGTGSAAMGGY